MRPRGKRRTSGACEASSEPWPPFTKPATKLRNFNPHPPSNPVRSGRRERPLEFPAESFDVAPVDFFPVNGLFTHAAITHSFLPGRCSWIVLRGVRVDVVHPS